MAYPSIFRFTRPRTFLYLLSLRTGTELIVLTLLINKLTGVYGLLALLTGLQLSWMQISMYIYSILALVLTAYLAPHVRKQSPMQCLALAWFYVLDSIINALYTVAFGIGWFLVLAEHHSGDPTNAPGGNMMGDAAGFTNPQYTVSKVEVVPTSVPSSGAGTVKMGPDTALVGHPNGASVGARASQASVRSALGDALLQSGSVASVTVISLLWIVRIYFILIIMAYARGVLRQHIILSSASSTTSQQRSDAGTTSAATGASTLAPTSAPDTALSNTSSAAEAKPMLSAPAFDAALSQALPSPFTPHATLSAGWTGKLGRIFVSVFRSYWLGAVADGEEPAVFHLTPPSSGHSRKSDVGATPGVFERERRRRAGTGPPMLKPIELAQMTK